MKKILLSTPKKLIISLCIITALLSSCKKDNPNILYTSFNKILSNTPGATATDSLDLNADTKMDFRVLSGINTTGDTLAAYLLGSAAGVYIDSTQTLSGAYVVKPLAKGIAPNKYGSAKEWKSFGIIALKRSADVLGFAGAGDQYIPFLILNISTGLYHYGWVRVNVSSDYVTYKVIDAAFSIIPDTPLKMGEK